MRILLITGEFPPDGAGGVATVVSNLALGYRARGHEVFVAAETPKSEHSGRDEWQGFPVERIFTDYHARWESWVTLWNPTATSVIKKVLKEWKPDIVHAHGVHYSLSYGVLVLAKRSGARVFLTAHDAMLYQGGKAKDESRLTEWTLLQRTKLRYNPLRNVITRYILRNYVSGIAAISHSLSRALRANHITVQAVVHNGIDVMAWQIPVNVLSEFKRKHGLGEEVVLYGGRLSGQKGAYVAVEAIAEVARIVTDVQLLVIGTQNETARRMRELAEKLGVTKNIVFTGRITGDELRAAYHSSALVTVLSRYLDALPTINLEAHACGKPVVATSIGGSPEIVKDGSTGYIVNPFHVQEIAGKIIELLQNKERAAQFGRAGYERVLRDFTLEEQIVAYERLFTQAGS